MKFHVVYEKVSGGARSPVRVVEQRTGQEVGWINRYLDREYVRRLSNKSLRLYAYNLLHFVRWWASVHHTGDIAKTDLSESMLLDHPISVHPEPSALRRYDQHSRRHRRPRPP
jgi:hypothetical protein